MVRAGIESDIFNNAACGLPVTSDQASIPGGHIRVVCDPPVIAQYISVDDDVPSLQVNSLALCEVMVEEYSMEECLQTSSKKIKKRIMTLFVMICFFVFFSEPF